MTLVNLITALMGFGVGFFLGYKIDRDQIVVALVCGVVGLVAGGAVPAIGFGALIFTVCWFVGEAFVSAGDRIFESRPKAGKPEEPDNFDWMEERDV